MITKATPAMEIPITKILVFPERGAYIEICGRWYRLEEVPPSEVPITVVTDI